MKSKVLIGSNGGLTGIYLAKNLKEMPNVMLYGADCDLDNAGRYFVERQYCLPNAYDTCFLDSLVDLLEKEKIDIYLPTHSIETRAIAQHADWLRANSKTEFLVSPKETFMALDDKVIANFQLQKIGIQVPKVIGDVPNKYPVFLKQRQGSGSKGTLKIENEMMYQACRETYPQAAFFQFLQGKEYTVDCLFDGTGQLLGYNQRARCKTLGGAVSVTQNDWSVELGSCIQKIAKKWVFCGCVNFQFIVQNGMAYCIDVNLRYPSGGLPLTVASGIDIPKLIIMLLRGEQIPEEMLALKRSNMKMYRYFEEIFEDAFF